MGTAYKLNSPNKNGVLCVDSGSNLQKNVVPGSCSETICWRAKIEPVESVRLIISGNIVDSTTCEPISDVMLDLWSTSAQGRYGSLRDGVDDYHCRAKLVSDSKGYFEFETDYPGNYGSFFGNGPSFLQDFPPYGPRHIHLIAYRDGYEAWINQIYFPNDTNGVDWRESFSPIDMQSTNPELVLNLTKDQNGKQSTTFNFSLEPKKRTDSLAYNDLLYQMICVENVDNIRPIPLCHPNYTFLVNTKIILTVFLITIYYSFYLMKYLLKRCFALVKS